MIQCFLVCFMTGSVCPDDYAVWKIYVFDYDNVAIKAGFFCFDCMLLSCSIMNSGYFMLFWILSPPCLTRDVGFNPHKPIRGSVQQSLSEI